MTTPQTGAETPVRPTAREVAHAYFQELIGRGYHVPDCVHHPEETCDVQCDRLTAAIDADRAENARACRALEGELRASRSREEAAVGLLREAVAAEFDSETVVDGKWRSWLTEARALLATLPGTAPAGPEPEPVALSQFNLDQMRRISKTRSIDDEPAAGPVVTPPAMPLFPDPRTVCAPCDGTGRETGLGGYDEPCRVCNGTGRAPSPTSPETPVGTGEGKR